MPKATWKKDAKKCAKKSFGLEIWCSWLCFRRPGARPGRPKSVPRAAQDGPKSCGSLGPALLGTFLLFFAILFEFWMIFHRFLLEFWLLLRRFLTESASNQSSQSKPKQAKASRSKPKEAKASKSQLELKFKISSTLDPACFCQAQSSVELILNLNSSWLLLALASFGLLLLAFA